MTAAVPSAQPPGKTYVAVDIGSTVVKLAKLAADGGILEQAFHPRDFEGGILAQVRELIDGAGFRPDNDAIRVCSSANGGLRVGVLCMTGTYSGAVLRNQVLLAGANPVYVHTLGQAAGDDRQVDVLIVGGGVDCEEQPHLSQCLERFDAQAYRFGSLIYAGSSALAGRFTAAHAGSVAIPNPLADSLRGESSSVLHALRRAYLDDLVYKEGVSELHHELGVTIHPTPEIVNRGFSRAVSQQSSLATGGPCILLDIGGATTDLHYTVEIVREDSEARPPAGSSVARYVFTDLGVVASYDSTVLQLRAHPRLYEFLRAALGGERSVQDTYRQVREGDHDPSPELLGYACVLLALDRFAHGGEQGLPAGELVKVNQVLLTGGAAQGLDPARVRSLFQCFLGSDQASAPQVLIDREYRIWTDGITWEEVLRAPAAVPR